MGGRPALWRLGQRAVDAGDWRPWTWRLRTRWLRAGTCGIWPTIRPIWRSARLGPARLGPVWPRPIRPGSIRPGRLRDAIWRAAIPGGVRRPVRLGTTAAIDAAGRR